MGREVSDGLRRSREENFVFVVGPAEKGESQTLPAQ